MSAVEQARAELMRRVTVWTEVRSESGWPLLRKEDAIDALIAAVRAERDAAREAFDNLSTLQQADRKELLDTRGQLATLRADLAAQVEGMLTDVPDRHSGTRREDFIRTRNRTLHRVIRILRGPHAD